MQLRSISKLLSLTLLLALTPRARGVDARFPTDATALGQRVVLPPTWLFSPTDNPANASPTLDDSTWTSISTDKPLSSYGFRYYRYAWYRTHIHIRPDTRNIAVETVDLSGRYQVFANGVLLGSFGNLADHSVTAQQTLLAFPIPDSVVTQSNGNLVLALRFSVPPAGQGGSGTAIPMSANASIALASQADSAANAITSFSIDWGFSVLIGGLNAFVGIVALALFLSIRTQREYLPLAVFLLEPLVRLSVYALAAQHGAVPFGPEVWAIRLLSGIAFVALVEFIRLVLAIPRNRWFLLFEIALLLAPLVQPLTFNGYLPVYLGFTLFFIPRLLLLIFLPALLIRSWNRDRDARLLLPAVLLTGINNYVSFLWWVCYFLHFTRQRAPTMVIHIHNFALSLFQCGDILFAVGMLFFILLRTVRISRSRAKLSAEIAAAATVQQLLLDRSSHPTPGFLVDTVFLPASSLGGDFFLVTSHPFDGSLIAVVGDVSGKGLTAAMRVAMILGVLRRETSHHPGDVLAYLNDAIIAQGELGFTTALCVRIFLNGDFILANAGHIPPFIAPNAREAQNARLPHPSELPRDEGGTTIAAPEPLASREFPTPPALPLGLVLGEVYELKKGHLAPGERLVLMSDGVPEARSHSGELYGFDRLQHLTLLSSHDIAATAQRFGQEDDITVLTLALAP
jgi:sigma-B regulation protein RsbU (phosphoserine phosphatase)